MGPLAKVGNSREGSLGARVMSLVFSVEVWRGLEWGSGSAGPDCPPSATEGWEVQSVAVHLFGQ